MATETARRQLNIRLKPGIYQALETIAREERRSVPQAAQQLIEDGLRSRVTPGKGAEDTPGTEIARLAAAGGAFAWLEEEPDLYDDTCGEPIA
ncbi:MAG: hypothetical protein JO250_24195 [Armatimonadetes bacterium]|nr:hypothetical protein [Armatimonadota bacterium]